MTMRPQDFNTLVESFESYLYSRQPSGHPDSLYAPIRYINTLGGKRIRPGLLLMAYNLWQEDINPAMPAALAIEYFHNFSLMHDDIMDEAPLRRGKTTVHKMFGQNSAILSGDAMLIQCFQLLLEAGNEHTDGALLCSLMSKAALDICEGQQYDMDFENQDTPSQADYLEMIRQKTACLLGVSLEMGALLAGAEADEAQRLYDFGERMGIGFQIQDDYLDVFGDEKLTGKQKGGDILQGKKNFLFVTACSKLSDTDRENFIALYANASRTNDTSGVYAVYNKLGIENQTLDLQSRFLEQGLKALDEVTSADTSMIRALAEKLSSRSY